MPRSLKGRELRQVSRAVDSTGEGWTAEREPAALRLWKIPHTPLSRQPVFWFQGFPAPARLWRGRLSTRYVTVMDLPCGTPSPQTSSQPRMVAGAPRASH